MSKKRSMLDRNADPVAQGQRERVKPKKTQSASKQLNVTVTEDQHTKLRLLAAKEGTTQSEIIQTFIDGIDLGF